MKYLIFLFCSCCTLPKYTSYSNSIKAQNQIKKDSALTNKYLPPKKIRKFILITFLIVSNL